MENEGAQSMLRVNKMAWVHLRQLHFGHPAKVLDVFLKFRSELRGVNLGIKINDFEWVKLEILTK